MSPLARKISITTSPKGLLIQPQTHSHHQHGKAHHIHTPPTSILIPYTSDRPHLIPQGKHNRSTPNSSHHDKNLSSTSVDCRGIIGILPLASSHYLIVITSSEKVAQIKGKTIYVITKVGFIPLTSETEAHTAIKDISRHKKRDGNVEEDELSEETASDSDEKVEGDGDLHDYDLDLETDVEHEDENIPQNTDGKEDLSPSILKDNKSAANSRKVSSNSIAKDVWRARGRYGRFADKWFSSAGWTVQGRAKLGMSSLLDDPDDEPAKGPNTVDKPSKILKDLTPKILHAAKLYFSARNFYYSYDYDLSKRLELQHSQSTSTLPLYEEFDDAYFWNKHLLKEIIDSEQHCLILPIIQGFIGQKSFSIQQSPPDMNDKILPMSPSSGESYELKNCSPQVESHNEKDKVVAENVEEFMLTLISRRSINRAGLRYLRRGIDDGGNVANNVETEQILSSPTWDIKKRISTLTQIRGSIPLFFSQSPYAFRPIPTMHGSEETNHDAFNKHFSSLIDKYGKVQIASLVDKHGNENGIGEMYQHHVTMTNDGSLPSYDFKDTKDNAEKYKLGFTWFDFHHECRAFNFQNVSYLLDVLSKTLDSISWTDMVDDKVGRKQSGIVRTNCMDCLDRTNVVQSAIAGHILQQQLSQYSLSIDLRSDLSTQWFNNLWADNGDAISRQYAGTAALKGDFTRTRKRGWTGAINDFSLTLGRYYNNIFGDYFLQTMIDYLLGNGGEEIWEDFESELRTGDYALDMKRVREEAVERCVRAVLGRGDTKSDDIDKSNTRQDDESEEEDLIGGWTLITPHVTNTIQGGEFEECVLLLTNKAVYAVRFDWSTEKPGSYERIEMESIVGIKRGVYITSTLGNKNLDEQKNYGFVIEYKEDRRGCIRRVNTRTLSTTLNDVTETDITKQDDTAKTVILAFKTIPARSMATTKSQSLSDNNYNMMTNVNEVELTALITDEIYHTLQKSYHGTNENGDQDLWEIGEESIISVSDAKKSTTLLDTIGYAIKKFVWS